MITMRLVLSSLEELYIKKDQWGHKSFKTVRSETKKCSLIQKTGVLQPLSRLNISWSLYANEIDFCL